MFFQLELIEIAQTPQPPSAILIVIILGGLDDFFPSDEFIFDHWFAFSGCVELLGWSLTIMFFFCVCVCVCVCVERKKRSECNPSANDYNGLHFLQHNLVCFQKGDRFFPGNVPQCSHPCQAKWYINYDKNVDPFLTMTMAIVCLRSTYFQWKVFFLLRCQG